MGEEFMFSFSSVACPCRDVNGQTISVLYGMTIRVNLVAVMSESSLHSALHAIYLIAPIDSQLIKGPLIMAPDKCVLMGVCKMLLALMSFEHQLRPTPCRALFC